MKNVNVGDLVFIDDTRKQWKVVKKTRDRKVVIQSDGIEIKSTIEHAINNYVKVPHVDVGEKVRLIESYSSRYFTEFEELEVRFMDLKEQDCIVKSLRGIYEQVPIDCLNKWD